jgi:hypothetical protein
MTEQQATDLLTKMDDLRGTVENLHTLAADVLAYGAAAFYALLGLLSVLIIASLIVAVQLRRKV